MLYDTVISETRTEKQGLTVKSQPRNVKGNHLPVIWKITAILRVWKLWLDNTK